MAFGTRHDIRRTGRNPEKPQIGSATSRYFRTAFPADISIVGSMRHVVEDRLAEWNVAKAADGAALATHELMANAVRHGCRSRSDMITLTMKCTAEELCISVHDPSSRLPEPGRASEIDESGRGLELVEAISDRWGTEPAPDGSGKRVWLAMRLRES